MEWYRVPKEEPSIIFPEGAVIEDERGIYKILQFRKQDNKFHLYKVEILTLKDPTEKPFEWMLVVPLSLEKIRRLS